MSTCVKESACKVKEAKLSLESSIRSLTIDGLNKLQSSVGEDHAA